MLALVHHRHAVHNDALDAPGERFGVLTGGGGLYLERVEDHHVRFELVAQQAPASLPLLELIPKVSLVVLPWKDERF